jgi:hypothetical protein
MVWQCDAVLGEARENETNNPLRPCGNPSHFFVKYILAPYNEKGIRN